MLAWLDAIPLEDASYTDHRLLVGAFQRHAPALRDRPEYPRLQGLVRSHWTQGRFVAHEVGPILRDWASLGLTPVLLKGASRLCLDPEASKSRMVRDIDILLPREQLAAAFESLAARGWESAEGESPACIRARLPVLRSKNLKGGKLADIDLHARAYKEFDDDPQSDAALWDRLAAGRFDGVSVHAPGPEDRLAIAISHGAWDAGKHSDWLIDAVHAMRCPGFDWAHLERIVVARRMAFLASPVLRFLHDELGAPVPADVLARLRGRPFTRAARGLMRADRDGIGRGLARMLRTRRGLARIGAAITAPRADPVRRFTGLTRRPRARADLSGAALTAPVAVEDGHETLVLDLVLDTPRCARRVQFELHGARGCLAQFRFLHRGTVGAGAVVRLARRPALARCDFPLVLMARPGKFLQAPEGSEEHERYKAVPFVVRRLAVTR